MDLALFDLDKTLISDDSSSLWLHWLVSQGYAPAISLAHHQQQMHAVTHYAAAPPDPAIITSYLQRTMAPMNGYHCHTVAGWVERFVHRDIMPRLYPQARQQLAWHRERGDAIALVSASGDYLLTTIARRLGVEHVFAVQAEISSQPRCFTGDTTGDIPFHQGSVRRLEAWLSQAGTPAFNKTYAYCDSVFDLPLLEFVDKPTVINGCRALRESSAANGWPQLSWLRHPARQTATT